MIMVCSSESDSDQRGDEEEMRRGGERRDRRLDVGEEGEEEAEYEQSPTSFVRSHAGKSTTPRDWDETSQLKMDVDSNGRFKSIKRQRHYMD